MDAADNDLRLLLKQTLNSLQPPADGRERLLEAAARLQPLGAGDNQKFPVSINQSRAWVSYLGEWEETGTDRPTQSDEPVRPLVRTPLLNAEQGWG